MVGERVEAGERKEESSQSTRRARKKEKRQTEHNGVPTVHENIVKYLKAMLFFMV